LPIEYFFDFSLAATARIRFSHREFGKSCFKKPVTRPISAYSHFFLDTPPEKPEINSVMKPIIPFALLSAFIAIPAAAQGTAVTTPVGYVTEQLDQGFNLVGLNLHEPTLASGQIVSSAGTVIELPDGALDGIDAAATHILEINSGALAGAVLVPDSVDTTTNELTFPNLPVNPAAGDGFTLREAATLGEVLGTADDVVISKGTSTTGDLVYLPDGQGGFDVFHHSEDSAFGAGDWQLVGGASQGADTPIVYTDAFFIQVKGAATELVVSGEVKTTDTMKAVFSGGFEYLSAVFPVGSTLNSLGLADSPGFKKGTGTTGDLVFIPATGGFRSFHHTEDSAFGAGEWTEIGGDGDGTVAIPSAIILQVRADTDYNASLNVPSSLSL
jgi:hypothetical protein